MDSTRAVLTIAGIPLLSGCMMMGGWGHLAGPMGTHVPGDVTSGQGMVASQQADASSDGLTITLSVPVPTGGALVTISAWLRADHDDREPADGEVWLHIRTPRGNVDRLRMREPGFVGEGTFHAEYAFATSGAYVVTAEARSGTGRDARTVSVTAEVEVGDARWDDSAQWVTPVVVVGSLGMLALMAVLMGGSPH